MLKQIGWMFVAAAALAVFSPLFAVLALDYADISQRHGLVYAWFYVLPVAVDQLLWLADPLQVMAVAICVYTAQYLALFLTGYGLLQLAPVGQDFLRPYKHRASLVR